MMHGRIWVESAAGDGSTSRSPPALVSPPTLLSRERRRHPGLRVLVVDDNAVNRRILTGQLGRWDVTPKTVSGGHEALQVLAEMATRLVNAWISYCSTHRCRAWTASSSPNRSASAMISTFHDHDADFVGAS